MSARHTVPQEAVNLRPKEWRDLGRKYPAGSEEQTICWFFGGANTLGDVIEAGHHAALFNFHKMIGVPVPKFSKADYEKLGEGYAEGSREQTVCFYLAGRYTVQEAIDMRVKELNKAASK